LSQGSGKNFTLRPVQGSLYLFFIAPITVGPLGGQKTVMKFLKVRNEVGGYEPSMAAAFGMGSAMTYFELLETRT